MRDTYIRFRYDKPISLLSILNSNGLDDALWAARCVEGAERDLRKFAVWCVRQVQHLLDERSINVIDTAERYADGEVTAAGLAAARSAAVAAATNGVAKSGSQYAAKAATLAASDCAWNAAIAAAEYATLDATYDAAYAMRAAQHEMFVRMLTGAAPWQKGGEASQDEQGLPNLGRREMTASGFRELKPTGYLTKEGLLVRFHNRLSYETARHYIETSELRLVFTVKQGFHEQRLAYVLEQEKRNETD